MRWPTGILVALMALGGTPLEAQRVDAGPDAPGFRWWRPVASLAVPGLGQLAGGQRRGWVYLAVEAVLVYEFGSAVHRGHVDRTRYRRIAFDVARAPFGPSVIDTAFSYYESMSKFVESGPFDTDPGPDLVPPVDETTFNGRIWGLARRTFFSDPNQPPPPDSPAWQRAITFYRSRAAGPGFEWSWAGAPDALADYRRTLESSDDAFQRATIFAGVVAANHLLSALDAWVSERLVHNRAEIGLALGRHPGAYGGRAGVNSAIRVRIPF